MLHFSQVQRENLPKHDCSVRKEICQAGCQSEEKTMCERSFGGVRTKGPTARDYPA